jgi:hypothetical protein
MDKIIGFTISSKKLDHSDVDIFNIGLIKKHITHSNFNIYLWGIGEINPLPTLPEQYSLATSRSTNLLDRNILLTLEKDKIIIENDWLASIPIFYNKKDCIISTLSLKTLTDKKVNFNGLAYYMKYGYCVFEQTPFENVNFMPAFTKIELKKNTLFFHKKLDPILSKDNWKETTSGDAVINQLRSYTNQGIGSDNSLCIIPTSGGFDSRLLNDFVEDKSRILSFTYGFSDRQSKSEDVVLAKELSKRLSTQWKQISITDAFSEIHDWFKIMGFSTHLHGMYHLKFLKNIHNNNSYNGSYLVSGILGDGWSGKHKPKPLKSSGDIFELGLSNDFNIDIQELRTSFDPQLEVNFYNQIKPYHDNQKVLLVFSMRLKIMLLSYLLTIPEYLGWPIVTPFLNYRLVKQILNIDNQDWQNRKWQKQYFRQKDIMLNDLKIPAQRENNIHYNSYLKHKFEHLDCEVLGEYLNSSYIHKQKSLTKFKKPFFVLRFLYNSYNSMFRIRGLSFLMKKIKLKKIRYKDHRIVAPYMVLKSFEMSIKN